VSRARGNVLQNALARYLTAWWPHAESTGAGRNGADVLGTPGVAWECKTADTFRPVEFCRQARRNAPGIALPVVVYWPRGVGEQSADVALAIVPLGLMMDLLVAAGYAPEPKEEASE
jgi:hypothetical protein